VHVSRLGEARAPRLPRRLVRPRFWPGAFRSSPSVELAASLDLSGKARPRTLDNVVVTLDAVCDGTGGVANIPLQLHRFDRRFDVYAKFDVAELFGRMGGADLDVHLRLRLVWNNVSWETTVARPRTARASYELNFARDDSLLLMRRIDQEDPA
jgi:hypothetical protein